MNDTTEHCTDGTERCVLCEPASHPNCEVWSEVEIKEPHGYIEAKRVPVCLGHYEAVEQFVETGTE